MDGVIKIVIVVENVYVFCYLMVSVVYVDELVKWFEFMIDYYIIKYYVDEWLKWINLDFVIF